MRPRAIAVMTSTLLVFAGRSRADEPSKAPAPRAEAVFSEAEGERAVVYIVPEGARVTKGQVVCVLDAATGPDARKDRKGTAAQAEAAYEQARLTREVADAAVKEYEGGTFKRSLETVEGDIALAMADLKRAEDRLAWSRKMREENRISEAQFKSDEFGLMKAQFTLEQAQTSKDVLLKYTKDKTLKQLHSAVEKARADEIARSNTLHRERAKIGSLDVGLRPSVILAPIDGKVVLARPTRLVAVGAEVCKDQLLMRIMP